MNKKLIKKFIIAQALADAFGYVIEFKDTESIKRNYGINGFLWDKYKESDVFYVSDDTQMSLFAWNACNNEGFHKNHKEIIRINYKDWFTTQTQPFDYEKRYGLLEFESLFARRAPGMTCLSALKVDGVFDMFNKANDSKGCGAIMRAGIFGFYATSAKEAFDYGVHQGAITHGHPEGYLSAGFYSCLIYLLLNGHGFKKSVLQAEEFLDTHKEHNLLSEKIQMTKWLIDNEPYLTFDALTKKLGLGWTGDEALMVAMYCSQTSNTFAEVLEKSANHSGDSDSCAMLAVGLWILQNETQELDSTLFELEKKLDIYDAIEYLNSHTKVH